MRTNWNRAGQNLFLGVECYRNHRGEWYARNMRTRVTSGPHKTRRAARFVAYELMRPL